MLYNAWNGHNQEHNIARLVLLKVAHLNILLMDYAKKTYIKHIHIIVTIGTEATYSIPM